MKLLIQEMEIMEVMMKIKVEMIQMMKMIKTKVETTQMVEILQITMEAKVKITQILLNHLIHKLVMLVY